MRAIYRYHTLFRRWGDIAYHYLIAADGRVFKGRYTGPPETRAQDRPVADRGWGRGVSGTHTLGANQGTVGIALLGNYQRQPLSAAARESLIKLLAWLSDRYGIDPRGRSVYQGPRGPRVTRNIAGHRAYGPTECPGDAVARDLPGIRGAVARLLAAPASLDPDEHLPSSRRCGRRRSAAKASCCVGRLTGRPGPWSGSAPREAIGADRPSPR